MHVPLTSSAKDGNRVVPRYDCLGLYQLGFAVSNKQIFYLGALATLFLTS